MTVAASRETQVEASPEVVWRLLARIEEWPSWNPDVKRAELDGDLEPGSVFRWKAGPSTITSTLTVVDAPHSIAWTGKTLGIRASHSWHLEGQGPNTIVRTEESYDGLVARVFSGPLQTTLEKALDTALDGLRSAARRDG